MAQSLIERLRKIEYFSDNIMAARTLNDETLIFTMRQERKEAANALELLENEVAVLRLKLENIKKIVEH